MKTMACGYHNVTYLKNLRNKFQEELKEDLSKIRKSRNMFVFADKTNNAYEMKPETMKN